MYIQLVGIFLVSWFLFLKWRRRNFDKLHEQLKISAPSLPLIGHLYLTFCNTEEILRNLQVLVKQAMQLGGLCSIWLGHKLYINIADAEVADIVLKACLEKDDIYKCFHFATGDGSIFTSAKTWRPRRKYNAQAFNIKNLNLYVETFSKQSGILVDKIKEKVAEGKSNYSMGKLYMLYSISAVFESLGININAQENEKNPYVIALKELLNAVAVRIFQPWLYHDFVYKLLPRYRKVEKQLSIVFGLFNMIIQEKRQEYENNHDSLKTAKDGQKRFIDQMLSDPANISNVVIREECLVMIAAAIDTSSVGIGYVTVMLARHPDVQEKVYQELKSIIGDVDRPIRPEDLPDMKYLGAVIKETLRLYPPVPAIVRKIDKNIELASGVTLIPGCGAIINIWAINRNPMYWGKDAEEFRPERFLDSAPRHPAAFATFSAGPRNCLGYQYALMSIKTVIATLLTKYRLTPAPDDKLEPLRLKFDIMMRDINDYHIRFQDRK